MKVRLLSKGKDRIKYPLPVEVIVDNLVRKVRLDQRKLMLGMSVGELGVEVQVYLKRELNSEMQGGPSVYSRVFRDVHDQVHEMLKEE